MLSRFVISIRPQRKRRISKVDFKGSNILPLGDLRFIRLLLKKTLYILLMVGYSIQGRLEFDPYLFYPISFISTMAKMFNDN